MGIAKKKARVLHTGQLARQQSIAVDFEMH